MLEREMFRLRLSFIHDKDRLLARVKVNNTGLYAFLDRASLIASGTSMSSPAKMKRSSSSKVVQPVLAFQRYSTAMWQSLQIQWSGCCPGGHPFALAVGQHNSGRADYPGLCFELLVSKDTDMRVKVIPFETPKEPSWTASAELPQQEAFSELRTKLSIANHLQKLNRKGKKAVQALILSTSAIRTPEEREKSRTDTLVFRPSSRSNLSVLKLLGHSRKTSSESVAGSASAATSPNRYAPSPRQVLYVTDAHNVNQS